MPQLIRAYWGHHHGRITLTLNDGDITHRSVVLATASEGDTGNSTASPQRFVGSATFRVCNIAPFDGGVHLVVEIDWDEGLPLWTDIVIMDGFPDGFLRSRDAMGEPQP